MKNERHFICSFFIVLFLFSFQVAAQKNNFKKGTIFLNKNKSIEAFIQMDFRFPQDFQTSLTYLTPEDYQRFQDLPKAKIKGLKSLQPKDVSGFDLANGASFRTVTYMDLSQTGSIGAKPRKLLLEKRVEGKIDVYKLYCHTSGNVSQKLSQVLQERYKEGDDHLIDYIQNNFQLLVKKNNENPKNLMAVNLLNYIGDNEIVKNNYRKNHYGFRDGFVDEGTGIVGKKLEDSFLRLLQDYDPGLRGQLSR